MPTLPTVTPDFLDTAPFRVVCEVTVAAPIAQCWSLIADQAAWVEWFEAMSSVVTTPWVWTESGHRRQVVVNGLKVDEEAMSFEPEQEYAFSIVKWPLPIAVRAAEGIRLADVFEEGSSPSGSPQTRLTYIGAFELTKMGQRLEGVLTKNFTQAWTPAFERLGALASAKAEARV